MPDAGGPEGCLPLPMDGGTSHPSSINADENWTEAGNPHLLPVDTTIYPGATVILSPCVVVRIAAGKTLSVTGVLEAQGTQRKPVRIERSDPLKPWASIRVSAGGRMRLTRTTVKGGGDPLTFSAFLAASIDINGDQSLPTQPALLVDNAEVLDSASQGIYLHGGGGFAPASVELKVSGSASYPIHVWSRSAGTIPTGGYTSNGTDQIVLSAQGLAESVSEDVTLKDRGVPYLVGHASSAGTLYVSKPGGLATLTIEPGVIMKFKKNGVLYVEPFSGPMAASGAMIAVGTAEKPIVFTSAEAAPAAGDWYGIWYGMTPSSANRLEFARVEYAGGDSVSGSGSCPITGSGIPNAAIRFKGSGPPSTGFVKSTTVFKSAKHGIDRGWRANAMIDFLPTNTFTDVPGCNQTYPSDMNGACPATPPCPK